MKEQLVTRTLAIIGALMVSVVVILGLFVTGPDINQGEVVRILPEADAEHKPFENHLSHLAVHGFLHLIGYDHEKDGDADIMEELERKILAQLGIPDPYAIEGQVN